MQRNAEDAKALRTMLLIIGIIMLVAGLATLAHGLVDFFEFVDWTSWPMGDIEKFIVALSVIDVVDGTVGATMGLLLVMLSWRPAVLSVRALLYPALVIGGTYMVLFWVTSLASSIAYVVYLGGLRELSQFVTQPAYLLPVLVGGIVLIRVGMRTSPRPRQGTQVVRSHPGSGL
ncbi:MAG: hypothetical protein AB1793_03935 [Candidatus Thermoplasmatota archaeon]